MGGVIQLNFYYTVFRRPAFSLATDCHCRIFLEWTFKTGGLLTYISALKAFSVLYRTLVRVCRAVESDELGHLLEQLLKKVSLACFYLLNFTGLGEASDLWLLERVLHIFGANFCLVMIKLVFCWQFKSLSVVVVLVLQLHTVVEYWILYLTAVWGYLCLKSLAYCTEF